MQFKCLNAYQLFEVLNSEILNKLKKFTPDKYIQELFISKTQEKVPDYIIIIIENNAYIGVLTVYFQNDSMHIDNFFVPDICSAKFCHIVLQLWKYLVHNFFAYILIHEFRCLKMYFHISPLDIDFKHIDMKTLHIDEKNKLWFDVIEPSKDKYIYLSSMNAKTLYKFDLTVTQYSKEVVSENVSPNLKQSKQSKQSTDNIFDDVIKKFDSNISILDDNINEKAVEEANSLGLILAKSKLKSLLYHSTGIGCFAGKEIKKKEEICRFQGKIINEKERQNILKDNNEYWCIALGTGTYLAPNVECCANYINSPFKCFIDGKACIANAKLIINKKNKRARVVASHNIKEGTEILMSYGKKFNMNPI